MTKETEANTAADDLRKAVITFPRPVRIGAMTVTQVTLREPLVEDELAVAADNPGAGQAQLEAALIARLTGLPVEGLVKGRSAIYRKFQGPLAFFASEPWKEWDEKYSSLLDLLAGAVPKSGG